MRSGAEPGIVFGGPAEINELLFEAATRPRCDLEAPIGALTHEQIAHLGCFGHLSQDCGIIATKNKHIAVALDGQSPEPIHRVDDVGTHTFGDGKLCMALECAEDLFGGVSCCPRVP
ncbi:unannotated protein [freshwater metagenome]|uniref:Unannotated protein n=1 Tax=freshwater metagenome TaxID=449393 RepID=A0A6J7G674_9ZZZZ